MDEEDSLPFYVCSAFDERLTVQVYLECIVGCLLCCVGITSLGTYERIKLSDIYNSKYVKDHGLLTDLQRSWDTTRYHPTLVSFNHRGSHVFNKQ